MNSMSSLSDIYNCVIENCMQKYNVSDTAREMWLNSLIPVKMDGNVFTFSTDSDFKRETIISLYKNHIEEQLQLILGVPMKINIIVENGGSSADSSGSTAADTASSAGAASAGSGVNGGAASDAPQVDKKITYTFDNFIVGPSNNLAFAAAKAVSKKQHERYNPLFIYGDSGLGKTHLLSAIQFEMQKNYPGINIIYIPAETFTNEFLHSIQTNTVDVFDEKYRSADALLIDDIQFIAGKDQTEEKFFHIFNELYNQNKVIVLTSDRPAKEIKSISDRLRTRFSSGLIADVKPPEYETRLAIIQRKADLLHFNISEDVIDYIANKLKSNIRQIEGVVTKLNALYNVSQTKPTINVAQTVIKDIVTDHQPIPVTVDKIINEVGKIYNIDPDEMRSQRRTANISQARKVAIYVIQDVTGMPYEAIGQEFNGRDHSTVVYAIKSVKEEMERDSGFRSVVEDIIKNVKTT
ncbi:MAG: chromosomal replication initiator protein DnaA [Oscillospiraceae bacterium]